TSPGLIRGAVAQDAKTFFSWGDGLYIWQSARPRLLSKGWFGEGGCLVDVDRDGRQDIIVQRGEGLGELIWISGHDRTVHRIDTGISMHDCIGTDLLGHKGILMV